MDLRDVQSRLAASHLYSGKVDGDLGPKTRAAIEVFLLQQAVNFSGWSSARRAIAAQQVICRLDGIEVGKVDGQVGTQSRYAFGIFDVRKAAGGRPVPVIENWRNDATAPQATPGGSAIVAGSAGSGTQTARVPSAYFLSVTRVNGSSLALWKQVQ